MTDRHVVALAAACWAGALAAFPIPLVIALIAATGAALAHRPIPIIFAGAVLATSLAARSEAAGSTMLPSSIVGEVVLTADPEPVTRGVRFEVIHEGRRYDTVAWGSAGGQIRNRLLGERLIISGRVRPIDPTSLWLRQRGVAGRLTIESVSGWQVGAPHHRIANSIRRTIESGAEPLPRSKQELLVGLVYGDDRFQSPVASDNFAAAGLTHLLAVSGQNVAFVMVIVGPVLRRFEYRGRFLLSLGVLFLFATLTRFEPSVMRASVMAAIASLAVVSGRLGSSVRFLALAVAALVCAQPAIAHSLAFQLSVAASAGILVFGPSIAQLVSGPRILVEAVSVTAAAQLAVAPLLIWRFDEMPVASLPANVLAGPAAGPVMMWGMTAGYIAGLAPSVAGLIHIPTGLLIGWIEVVAATAGWLPLGNGGVLHLVGLAIGLWTLILGPLRPHGSSLRSRVVRRLACGVISIALVQPACAVAIAPKRSFEVDATTRVWRDESWTVVELGSAPIDEVLAVLRRHNVGEIDLLTLPSGGLGDWDRFKTLEQRHDVAAVWSHRNDTVPGTIVPGTGWSLQIDGQQLEICDDPDALRLCLRD